MKSSNPVLGKAFNQPTTMRVDQLEQSYNAPAASSIRTGRMTMEDVVAKTGFLFAILVVVGAFAWNANLGMGAVLNAVSYTRAHAILPGQFEMLNDHGGAPMLNVVDVGLTIPLRVALYNVPFK